MSIPSCSGQLPPVGDAESGTLTKRPRRYVGSSIPPLAICGYSVLNAPPMATINTSNRPSIAARLIPGAYEPAQAAT